MHTYVHAHPHYTLASHLTSITIYWYFFSEWQWKRRCCVCRWEKDRTHRQNRISKLTCSWVELTSLPDKELRVNNKYIDIINIWEGYILKLTSQKWKIYERGCVHVNNVMSDLLFMCLHTDTMCTTRGGLLVADQTHTSRLGIGPISGFRYGHQFLLNPNTHTTSAHSYTPHTHRMHLTHAHTHTHTHPKSPTPRAHIFLQAKKLQKHISNITSTPTYTLPLKYSYINLILTLSPQRKHSMELLGKRNTRQNSFGHSVWCCGSRLPHSL